MKLKKNGTSISFLGSGSRTLFEFEMIHLFYNMSAWMFSGKASFFVLFLKLLYVKQKGFPSGQTCVKSVLFFFFFFFIQHEVVFHFWFGDRFTVADVNLLCAGLHALRRALGGSHQPPSDQQLMGTVTVTLQDLQWAMSVVKPSAMREVAIDVPKVH